MGWEAIAAGKKASLLNLIPQPWQLSPGEIPSVTSLCDVTDYICRLLDPREVEITSSSCLKTLENVRSGEWTSLDVTRAFCHRAALAHQLVSICGHCLFLSLRAHLLTSKVDQLSV